MVSTPDGAIILLEVRDEVNFQTTFSALDLSKNEFLWRDRMIQEQWWISLVGAKDNLAFLQSYQGSGNPDHKNLIAVDISNGETRWTAEQFSLYGWGEDGQLLGFSTHNEFQQATIEVKSGQLSPGTWKSSVLENSEVAKSPITYLQGSDHFESVKNFVGKYVNEPISQGLEYLESEKIIGISYYVTHGEVLANYLLVTDKDGNRLLQEKLGENLPGLGVHTFFTLGDCVIFVKNKCEMVSYSLYD
jgi:hypothetical protein